MSGNIAQPGVKADMRKILAVLLLLALTACSSTATKEDAGPSSITANPCATPGATYLQSFTTVSGDCGPVPGQVLNVGNDGTVTTGSPIKCDKVEQDGCRAHDTNCRQNVDSNGVPCHVTSTFETTFTDDGSSASGIESVNISCDDGSSCNGTYEFAMERR